MGIANWFNHSRDTAMVVNTQKCETEASEFISRLLYGYDISAGLKIIEFKYTNIYFSTWKYVDLTSN